MVPKIVFIIPYKNRELEKTHFSVYMSYLLEDYLENDYEIYYSHQTENKPFTRGGTKNIGFLCVKKKYPNDYKNITFVFNDIDTLPIKKNILEYETLKGIVKHFYGFTYTLGGIFSITGEDFELCNGFPNLYGWGLEDNAMNDRVIKNNLIIDRSVFFNIHSREIIHIMDSSKRLINNRDPGDYQGNNLKDNLYSIKELNYNIVENEENKKNILKNEFMINIISFKTLLDPLSQNYYIKNVEKNSNLRNNLLKKPGEGVVWSLNRINYNKKI
jgi:hypothetical protein